MDDSAFDSIVSAFYLAAGGSSSWESALEEMRTGFGARSANVHTLDTRNGRILSMHAAGRNMDEANLDYVKSFHSMDPVRRLSTERGDIRPGKWVHCNEYLDEEFVSHDPFYQDFSLPYDIRYNSSVTISLENSIFTGCTLLLPKSRGALSLDEREKARRLGDHLRDALLMHEKVRSLFSQAIAGHSLLDRFPYPMLLFNKDRFITFQNQAATSEFETETRLGRLGLRLALTRDRCDQELSEKLMVLFQSDHGANAIVNLRASKDDPPCCLHLSLIAPQGAMGAFGMQTQVLATLFDTQQVGTLDRFALANMYHLTPAESRVAVEMVAGLKAGEISKKCGTAISTIQSQIVSILSKLGVHRNIDVARIISRNDLLWRNTGKTQ